ncbi:unnamed protein product [Prunus armeniaca]|uniref:Alliinase C-terminal domain-containing protein n=1 Tax=Prunus armeniaca TaxID=36596 RepID=A0A6J5Y109_PRUAR|nr:unnamed protein product [Prunus armeniaca]
MAKLQSSYFVCFGFSIFVNLFFVLKLYVGGEWELSWSRRAAEDAEHVAAISCSGHGRAYLDGLVLDGKEPVCECNSCYGGPDCSEFLTACAANVDKYSLSLSLSLEKACSLENDMGDPLFLEPFWMQHAAKSAVVVAGWHRMSYTFSDQSYISAELERHIRQLHAIVGNAVTQGRYIIFGAASTQLLNAAVHALSSHNSSSSSSPASVVASIPYYNLYQLQTELFQSTNYVFQGDASLLQNISDDTTIFIEFVTSPNNPDGHLNKAIFQGPNAKAIYDRVYYWPHFTAIPAPADDELMIFSISKFTGHAGSRFGWAVVKDESVYKRMSEYIELSSLGVSRDAQLGSSKAGRGPRVVVPRLEDVPGLIPF